MDLRAVVAVVWSLVLVVVFTPAVVVAGAAGEEGVLDSEKFAIGEQNLTPWANGLLNFTPVALGSADSPPEAKLPLVLAAKKTRRPDVLRKFKYYRGGWDITNKHYWTSVGSTGAGAFILALLWFVSFGLALGVRHSNKWCDWMHSSFCWTG